MKNKKLGIFIKLSYLIKNKRFLYISSIIFLTFFSMTLNMAFSAFTNRQENITANIKIKNMSYGVVINGTAGTKLTISGNKTTTANLIINSLNNIDSKYELIYKVCSTSECNTYIEKPESLSVEYSSKTIDTISGTIASSGAKQIRIAVTNTTSTIYYIELGINAGYVHNTLALQNLITTEYNEEDVTIAAIIDGEISTTFPLTNDYATTVTCTTNGGASNASGSATWNGTKWVINITGADSGRTICNVNFFVPFSNYIIGLASNSINTGVYNENGYRYEGLNPNNYVTFNNETWRIIGVFDETTHGKTGENLVKIIKDNTIGDYLWDSNTLNDWNASSLKAYLNGDYYNNLNQGSKNLIENISWKLGGYSNYTATTTSQSYTAERGTAVYSGRPTIGEGYIGLMYPSDYGYASLSSSCARTIELYNYVLSGCYDQNWLFKNFNQWTLTPYSSHSSRVYHIYYNGYVNHNNTNSSYSTRPALYLKSNATKLSGDGTSGNPYIIEV